MRDSPTGTPFEKFRRYSEWNLFLGIALIGFILGISFANATATATTVPYLVLVLVQAVTCGFALQRRLAQIYDDTPAPKTTTTIHLVVSAAATALAPLAAAPSATPGLTTTAGAVLGSLLLAVVPFALRMRNNPLTLIGAGMAAATTLVWWLGAASVDATAADHGRWMPVAFSSGFIALGGLAAIRLTVWMLDLMREQAEMGRIRSELAVAEERLRFSRDLHDIFGRTLTVVAVKSDLAAELAEAGAAAPAAAQSREVHLLAEEALREVRAVVAGYRVVDLDAELAGARAMLESAGIRPRIIGDAEGIPHPVAAALAWVVREGVTNIVRHSNAANASITLDATSAEAVLTIVNDGARRASDGSTRGSGTGLSGLRSRVEPLGGTLEVSAGDSFTLTARIPLEEAP